MSLYNALFGFNPHAPLLLSFLGITANDVPRFRDCFVDDGQIVVYTRTGGGNREYYENAASRAREYEDSEYSGPWNDDLRALAGFVRDEDDDFDCTYASFYFEPSPDIAKLVGQLVAIGAESNPAERWQALFKDMQENRDSAAVQRAMEVGKPIIEAITAALDGKSEDAA